MRRRLTAAMAAVASVTALVGCSAATATAGSTLPPALGAQQATPTGRYTLVQEPNAGLSPLYALIRSAHATIDMTMYDLEDTTAEADLVAAAERGVDVSVILDRDYETGAYNTSAYDRLAAGGVHVEWAPPDTIVHQKTITVDGTVSAIGTANLTSRYYRTSRDAWILDRNPAQVTAITETFQNDFAAAPAALGSTVPAAGLLWSPGAEAGMVAAIEAARTSVDFSSEELDDGYVVDALVADAQRGVRCEIVMTASSSWAANFERVRQAGCSVHVFPDTDNSLYIHEKEVITDGDALLIGSQNASISSLLYNRELSLELTTAAAPQVLHAAVATFDRDYARSAEWRG